MSQIAPVKLGFKLVPASNSNVMDNINYITSGLLRSSTIDPPNHTNIIAKVDSGASNNYWCTEDLPVLTDITDISNVPIVQLPKISTMSANQTVQIPLSAILSQQAKNHIFLMGFTLYLLSPWVNCVTMIASPFWIRIILMSSDILN